MKTTALIILLFFFSELALSQKKFEEVIIQTSAQCGDCKERIESKLNYTKGVIFAELELESKKVTVKYKTKFITLLEIKKAIASIGYSADEIKAKEEDVLKLPKCCQPGGH